MLLLLFFFFVELDERHFPRCVFPPLADACVCLAFSFPVLIVLTPRYQKKTSVGGVASIFPRTESFENFGESFTTLCIKKLNFVFWASSFSLTTAFLKPLFFKVLFLKEDITNKRTTSTKRKNVHSLCLHGDRWNNTSLPPPLFFHSSIPPPLPLILSDLSHCHLV